MRKLKDVKVNLVSVVDRASIRRKFYLKKREDTMTKELALKLLKAPELSAEEIAAIIAMVPEADQAELKAAVEAAVAPKDDKMIVEEIAQACSNKLTKATEEQMGKLEEHLKALTELIAGMKAPAAPEANKVEEPMAPEAKVPEVKEPAAEVPKEEVEPEITADDLKKMIQEALKR